MPRFLSTFFLLFYFALVAAQSPLFKDSVEVQRTDTIFFDFGSAGITPKARLVLDKLWEHYQAPYELYLEGHTDAVGSQAMNQQLSQRRAEVVRSYLVQKGWPAKDISSRSFGKQQLLIPTQAKEERNRRVFIRSGIPHKYKLYRGQVTDTLGRPLAAGLIAHGKYLRDTTRADENGYFKVWLPVNQIIGLDIYAPGYFFFSQLFKVDGNKPSNFKIELKEAISGAKMDIPDLFYVGNQAILLERSKPSLPRVLNFLQMNPDIKIEIAGHVNHPLPKKGSGTFEWALAEARANMVKDYLIQNGIAPERLSAKGYSNHELRYPQPKNTEQQAANRRVEIRIQ